MAIPTPRTWVDRDPLNTTTLNTGVRDGITFAQGPPGAVATRPGGSTQSIPNNTVTAVTFTVETFDNMAGFAATSSTITVSEAGVYAVTAGGAFAANATGLRVIAIQQNGVDVPGGLQEANAPAGGGIGYINVSQHILASAGDTVIVNVLQTSGGALNIDACRLSVVRATGS